MQSTDYDYIIVGAGSAGCTLAHRLTEDGDARVLLIEAGGWDRDPWLSIPLAWGRILHRRLVVDQRDGLCARPPRRL